MMKYIKQNFGSLWCDEIIKQKDSLNAKNTKTNKQFTISFDKKYTLSISYVVLEWYAQQMTSSRISKRAEFTSEKYKNKYDIFR